MKLFCVIILVITVFSCKPDKLIDIDFNPGEIKLARINDNDMKQNETETNQKIMEVLDKPFENIEIGILSEYSQERLFNGIEELLDVFNITIAKDIIEKFNTNNLYKEIKIIINNLTLYIYREHDNRFKLFFMEYNNNFYEPKLKIDYSKDDVINLLGNPFAYSDERNLLIYYSQNSLRQINIYFENDTVKYIQLISWGGI